MTAAPCPAPLQKICTRRTPGSFPLACPVLLVLQVLARSLQVPSGCAMLQDGFATPLPWYFGDLFALPQPHGRLGGCSRMGRSCGSRWLGRWGVCAAGGSQPGVWGAWKGGHWGARSEKRTLPCSVGLAWGPKICQGWERTCWHPSRGRRIRSAASAIDFLLWSSARKMRRWGCRAAAVICRLRAVSWRDGN